MLRLILVGLSGLQVLPPAKSYRLVGRFLQDGTTGRRIAHRENRFWEAGREFFSRIEIGGPVVASLVNRGAQEIVGVFPFLTLRDCQLDEPRGALAELDDQQWKLRIDGTSWSALILRGS